jgi:hypothetical protein
LDFCKIDHCKEVSSYIINTRERLLNKECIQLLECAYKYDSGECFCMIIMKYLAEKFVPMSGPGVPVGGVNMSMVHAQDYLMKGNTIILMGVPENLVKKAFIYKKESILNALKQNDALDKYAARVEGGPLRNWVMHHAPSIGYQKFEV